jgi:YggT family protein
MSWVSPDPRNPVVQIIHSLTEPVMEPFRKIIPTIGVIDISAMVLIFVVYFIKTMLVRLVGIIF